jgi:uncharacterized protein YigE (DUF2233 family)
MNFRLFIILLSGLAAAILLDSCSGKTGDQAGFVFYRADPGKQEIVLYWKDGQGKPFGSIGNLKNWLLKQNKQLIFAMNGGMFKPDYSPQGLFIQNGEIVRPLDTLSGKGNFYLKPNGVFYITYSNKAHVVSSNKFKNRDVKYATQSGPMLITDGQIHPAFKQGSQNLNVRNGVAIMPDGKVLFAMSKQPINFYDFALFFKEHGCMNALYLDGLVSRTYLPEQGWEQLNGNFGVIIAACKPE